MSFTDTVKHELVRRDNGKQSLELTELAAIFRLKNATSSTGKGLGARLKFYHGDLARRVYILLKNSFHLTVEIVVSRRQHFSSGHIYEVILPPEQNNQEFMENMGFFRTDEGIDFYLPENCLQDRQQQKAYIRGAFLAVGSVNKPRSEYHLEFRCRTDEQQRELVGVLQGFELEGHCFKHNGNRVIYFKSFSEITTLLNIIGAHQALLRLEEAQVVKDVKNNVNRRVNCETANLDKTVRAAMNQLENIKRIEQELGMDKLSGSLREIAALRKQHPYASLKELGQMLTPVLSKSGVNHRLRRISRIARDLESDS